MSLPDVPVTVVDGGLGQLPANSSKQTVKVGVCSVGVVGILYGVSTIGALTSTLGQGKLVEAGAVHLAVAGGPLYLMPINASSQGSAGAVTHTGSGAATMAATAAPAQAIAIACVFSGALGTAQFQFTVGTGTPFTVVSAAGWSSTGYQIPGTQTIATFTAGTYLSTATQDTYTMTTTSTAVTHATGTGPAVTQSSSPLDDYNALITIKTAGSPGTGAFIYSLDGGTTPSQTVAIPGSGLYAIPNTGVFLTFALAAVVGDTYAFTTTSPGYTTTDATNAFTTLLGLSQAWEFGHLVGAASNSANAATMASTVDTQMQAAFALFRFARWFVECPTSESDSTVIAAFASFASVQGRVAVCAGDFGCTSPITGRVIRRNDAWIITARLASVNAGQDGADVGLGSLGGIVNSLYRDDGALGGTFDGARFCSLRSIIGKTGYFITNVRTMANAGSDFTYMTACRVMDKTCTIARAALLNYLNHGVRVDKTTGFIDERDAQRIEKAVNAQLKAGVVDTGDATQATIQLSRTNNILSTNQEPVTCSVIPLGYFRNIPLTVGFTNPALAS